MAENSRDGQTLKDGRAGELDTWVEHVNEAAGAQDGLQQTGLENKKRLT